MGEARKGGFSLKELEIEEWDDDPPVSPLSLAWFVIRFCDGISVSSIQFEKEAS